jgi:6-phosphogluconolactonase
VPKLLVGSYSEGGPDGVRVVDFDSAAGTLRLERILPGAPDASWFAWDAPTRRLYATDEFAPAIGAFTLDPGLTALAPLGTRAAQATSPCYLAFSPDRSRLAMADYGSDVVEIHRLDAAGALVSGPQILRGSRTDAAGHAHWVQWSPEGDRLYLVDLGHDEIRMHAVAADGSLGPAATAFRTPAKAGPRHLAFHGELALLLTEYANTLTALRREPDGTLTAIETVSTLPAGYAQTSYGAHIQLVGDIAYVSNRGHNSIAAFRIGAAGRLTHLQTIGCGGDWPRSFLQLGAHLIVANQKSDNLVLFAVAPDGTLRPTETVLALPRPVAILAL